MAVKKPTMQRVAVLGPGGVLAGYRITTAEHRLDGEIAVPADCDLAPGGYVWRDNAFWPLAPADTASDIPPDAAGAAAALIIALAAGEPVPAAAKRWADWYMTTLDARGAGQ